MNSRCLAVPFRQTVSLMGILFLSWEVTACFKVRHSAEHPLTHKNTFRKTLKNKQFLSQMFVPNIWHAFQISGTALVQSMVQNLGAPAHRQQTWPGSVEPGPSWKSTITRKVTRGTSSFWCCGHFCDVSYTIENQSYSMRFLCTCIGGYGVHIRIMKSPSKAFLELLPRHLPDLASAL